MNSYKFSKANNRMNNRVSQGQGLIESACGTIMFVMVFVLLVAFALNFYFSLVAHEKMRIVAMECARVVDSKRYWLGMERPDVDPAAVETSAHNLANSLCSKLGLPQPSNVDFKMEKDATDTSVTFTTCTVTCNSIPLPYGFTKVFPNILSVSETGVSGNMALNPYSMLYVECPLAGKDLKGGALGGRAAFLLPMYGTAFPNVTANSGDHYRDPLHGGIPLGPIAGPFKGARLSIDPPGSVTQLNAEIANFDQNGAFESYGTISAF